MRDRKYQLLISVLFVALLLLTFEGRGTERAGMVLAWTTMPAQTLVAKLHRSAFAVWSTYQEWKGFRRENRALREEAEQLRVDSLRVRELKAENLRLRRLLAFKEPLQLDAMPAEVIAKEWSGWVRSLTVNRGRRDRIRRLMPVIAPHGLVGRVVAVRDGAAVIQLLNDPSSTVGAMVQRTRTLGMVEGEAGGTLRFKFQTREGDGVRVDDLVVTAGLGDLFPKGLPVGRVAKLEVRESALFQFAQLVPVVDYASVEEVLLLTEQSGIDLLPRLAAPSRSVAVGE
ncbi:MAG: rod shape-determining protein MreC [Candidatus Methylomirabilia bacterium]